MNNKKKIAFVTGVTGQDGSLLAEFLLKIYCSWNEKENIIIIN